MLTYASDLIGTPDKAAALSELEIQRQRLEDEREKHTEATLALGREKAALEAERLHFLEEKRAFMVQSILDDLPPTPDVSGKTQPEAPKPVEELKPLALVQPPISKRPVIPTKVVPMQASKIAPVVPAVTQTLVLDMEKTALATSTTPPITEDELSPTSPTEQRSNPKRTIHPPSIPPRFRKPKTPKRPVHPQARAAHKYSPAVPSPLSRMRTTESPPSSPESKAQQAASRPPVIVEEEEHDQGPDEIKIVEEIIAVAEEIEIVAVDKPVESRTGSLSPLSRIMNMGLSPAIAPTLAISSFPGLLGTGSLTQNLAKSRQPIKGFGNMPGGFQLGTAIHPQPSTRDSTTVTTKVKQVRATTITKQRLPPPPKKVLGENHPRTSKESTSSSGSASTSDGRSSAASSKRSATSSGPIVRGKATAPPPEKENVKKAVPTKPIVTRRPAPVAARADLKGPPAMKKVAVPGRSAPTRLKT